MKKFLVLYMAPSSVIEEWKNTPVEKRDAAEKEMQGQWQAWAKDHASAIRETAGAGATTRITKDAVASAKNDIMLYSVIEAESGEAATELFKNHPHLGIPQASIEIMPINMLPGMQE